MLEHEYRHKEVLMREKLTEQKLVRAVKAAGGIAVKFVSPGYDGMGGADKLAAQIDKLDILRERYSQAMEYMVWFEPAWSSMTDTEQHILSEFYMTDNQKSGATYRLMSELNYSESHVERLRLNALNHLRSLLYGI